MSRDTDWLDSRTAVADKTEDLLWYDIGALDVEGRGWTDVKEPYHRFPARAEGIVRPEVWERSMNSSGLRVRFVSDATRFHAKWRLKLPVNPRDHMAVTGTSGLDLYARHRGKWTWAGVARGAQLPESRTVMTAELLAGTREYMLYLPLYNIVESVQIGIARASIIGKAPGYEGGAARPIVFYGTSIVHGGCASRPGMTYPAIIGRRLDRPFINLGFSAQGRGEPEVARLLAELDPSAYVLDPLPNMTPDMVTERIELFAAILREARPATPIVLVENLRYQSGELRHVRGQLYKAKNEQLRSVYGRMLAGGWKNLHYIPGDNLLGDDNDATVDGGHPTDAGFLRMAAVIGEHLKQLFGGQPVVAPKDATI